MKFSSTDSILNSLNSESLMNGFETENNISTNTTNKLSPSKSKHIDLIQNMQLKFKKFSILYVKALILFLKCI